MYDLRRVELTSNEMHICTDSVIEEDLLRDLRSIEPGMYRRSSNEVVDST